MLVTDMLLDEFLGGRTAVELIPPFCRPCKNENNLHGIMSPLASKWNIHHFVFRGDIVR